MHIEKVTEIPFDNFLSLLEESENEGYGFLRRLEHQWKEESNRFALQGESLYRVIQGADLIGIGGINKDPFANSERVGRVRRFYVKKSHRNKGVGSMLLQHILLNHWEYFEEVRLRTYSNDASKFYLSQGFQEALNEENYTHAKLRTRDKQNFKKNDFD
jgi:GNAT superfamily N-acetyltransferase